MTDLLISCIICSANCRTEDQLNKIESRTVNGSSRGSKHTCCVSMRMMLVHCSAQQRRQLFNKQMKLKFPRTFRGHPVPVIFFRIIIRILDRFSLYVSQLYDRDYLLMMTKSNCIFCGLFSSLVGQLTIIMHHVNCLSDGTLFSSCL